MTGAWREGGSLQDEYRLNYLWSAEMLITPSFLVLSKLSQHYKKYGAHVQWWYGSNCSVEAIGVYQWDVVEFSTHAYPFFGIFPLSIILFAGGFREGRAAASTQDPISNSDGFFSQSSLTLSLHSKTVLEITHWNTQLMINTELALPSLAIHAH